MSDELFKTNHHPVDESLTVSNQGRGVDFEIDSPWYGDTKSGFGANLRITLLADEVRRLHKALGKWLSKQKETA